MLSGGRRQDEKRRSSDIGPKHIPIQQIDRNSNVISPHVCMNVLFCPFVLVTRASPGPYRMVGSWRRNVVFTTKVPVKSVALRGEL